MFKTPFKSTPMLLPQDKVTDKISKGTLCLSIFGEANHLKMCESNPGRTSLQVLTSERTMFNALSRALKLKLAFTLLLCLSSDSLLH